MQCVLQRLTCGLLFGEFGEVARGDGGEALDADRDENLAKPRHGGVGVGLIRVPPSNRTGWRGWGLIYELFANLGVEIGDHVPYYIRMKPFHTRQNHP